MPCPYRFYPNTGVSADNTPYIRILPGPWVSPLLANVYLHRLDRAWRPAYGTLVRYADDLLVCCRSEGQAKAALARLTVLLA